jgi:hypothetical protein
MTRADHAISLVLRDGFNQNFAGSVEGYRCYSGDVAKQIFGMLLRVATELKYFGGDQWSHLLYRLMLDCEYFIQL